MSTITHKGQTGIFTTKRVEGGKINGAAMLADFEAAVAHLIASEVNDLDSIESEFNQLFLSPEFLTRNSIAKDQLVRALFRQRERSGKNVVVTGTDAKSGKPTTRGYTSDEENQVYVDLEEKLTTYLASRPDRIHCGQGTGVVIRSIPGDVVLDEDNQPTYDAEGMPVPRTRMSDEEWAKVEAARAAAEARRAAKAAEKAAKASK